MTLILDAGAFVALERNDRAMWRRLKAAKLAGTPPRTHGGVIAQVWRGGVGRQAPLASAMKSIETTPLDEGLGRLAGVLLARCGMDDAIDAAVVALAHRDDQIITSDPGDIAALVDAAKLICDVVLS